MMGNERWCLAMGRREVSYDAGMIRFHQVWHHYGVKPVLRGIDLEVRPGELLCVMGPNGMGKSTLMAVAAGVQPCFRGHVEIGGRRRRLSVEAEAAVRAQVAYLPAEPWLPWVTARQFLVACGRVYGVSDERLFDHVDRLLKLFQLESQADKSAGELSTGQRKKLGLCSALVTEAPVLLLDEPFSGGIDASGLRSMSAVLQHLAEDRERTVMICVPVPELVEHLAHRIAVIHEGQILACNTVEGLRQQADCTGDLSEVLERLVSGGADPVQDYFQSEDAR